MLRKDKEITSRADIDAVIQAATICHLAFAADDHPYVLPLSFGYDGRCIYIHTARRGRKIDIIERNPRVAFAFESEVRPLLNPVEPCHSTFAFKSVAGEGTILELTDQHAKIEGLNRIIRHYAGEGDWDFPEQKVKAVRVWRIDISAISGKKSPARAAAD